MSEEAPLTKDFLRWEVYGGKLPLLTGGCGGRGSI